MIYCDTSALIKLYIEEAHSDVLKTHIADTEAVAVCRITWAEAYAALARRAREVPEDRNTIEAAKTALKNDWPNYVVIEVSQAIVARAGEYAETFALRGYDSVQLAAAAEVAQITGVDLDFACFDIRLNKAANVLNLNAIFDI